MSKNQDQMLEFQAENVRRAQAALDAVDVNGPDGVDRLLEASQRWRAEFHIYKEMAQGCELLVGRPKPRRKPKPGDEDLSPAIFDNAF